MALSASIVVPTRDRAGYLRVALASLLPQAGAAGAEVLVVRDGTDPATDAVAAEAGVRVAGHERSLGLNAARNTGIEQTTGELVCFVDDDVEVRAGWLDALLRAAEAEPEVDCFAGAIFARFEDHAFRMCGREGAPVTSLDLGAGDTDAPHAWGANMAIRRSAVARVGEFDIDRELYGDEQEWQDRLRASERPRIRYVAAAALDHRRAGDDARLGSLMRAARRRGRASRRYDVHKGAAPSLGAEIRTLAGTLVHGPRFWCANGPVMAAHTVGRIEAALRPGAALGGPDFLSGHSGTVGGRRGTLRAIADRVLDGLGAVGRRRVARAAARAGVRRSVLVAQIERPENAAVAAAARAELERSRHDVRIVVAAPEGRGKFQALRGLLATEGSDPSVARPGEKKGTVPFFSDADWLIVVDDDVVLPPGFLDAFVHLAEGAGLRLAQPAHRLAGHAAWSVTRRRAGSLVRETAFVEIGPVTAFHRDTFGVLLPFPDLRMGWGLDVHWAALAREHGWPIGVVDATPVLHAIAPAGDAYGHDEAIAEAREFLRDRPYVPRDEANRTLKRVL